MPPLISFGVQDPALSLASQGLSHCGSFLKRATIEKVRTGNAELSCQWVCGRHLSPRPGHHGEGTMTAICTCSLTGCCDAMACACPGHIIRETKLSGQLHGFKPAEPTCVGSLAHLPPRAAGWCRRQEQSESCGPRLIRLEMLLSGMISPHPPHMALALGPGAP